MQPIPIQITAADKKTFSFTNTSQGNLSTISWDFGDGSPVLNTLNATHTFPSSGAYVTKLTVTDIITGCSDTYSQTIYTADPSLVNADSSVCKNDSTTFTVVNTYHESFCDIHLACRRPGKGSFERFFIILLRRTL